MHMVLMSLEPFWPYAAATVDTLLARAILLQTTTTLAAHSASYQLTCLTAVHPKKHHNTGSEHVAEMLTVRQYSIDCLDVVCMCKGMMACKIQLSR